MRETLAAVVAAVVLASPLNADEPPGKYEVVTPKDDGIVATGINEHGVVIGFEWTEDKKNPSVLNQSPFIAKGKDITYLPLLDGYTSTFPAGVSDDETVVGRASKPGTRVSMRNQGFVWDAKSGIRGLGTLEGDSSSVACGLARNGRRISGFSVGDKRMRACIWNRRGNAWVAEALPDKDWLGSQVAVISGDGKHVASMSGQSACVWSEDEKGVWTQVAIAAGKAFAPRAVNDAGDVVGVESTGDGLSHAAIWTRDAGYKWLEVPSRFVRSEAHAINNKGVVVGMVDGPGGSEIGPKGFIYERGKMRLIDEAGPNFADATAINDHGQIAGVFEQPETHVEKCNDPGNRAVKSTGP